MRTLILSGLSGSGKSSAIHALEDAGFYCVDNLPVVLLRSFLELAEHSKAEIQKFAIVVDARDQTHIGDLPKVVKQIRADGRELELLFLTASNDSLLKRFKETRRPHPLAPTGTVLDGIERERKLLEPFHNLANESLDTSQFTPHELRKHILNRYGGVQRQATLSVQIVSFGFKYGIPLNADLLLDVRFLANPYFREELRGRTGLDQEVADFVHKQSDAGALLKHYLKFLLFVLPRYAQEGKSYLEIGIGCTGGKHRSVVLAMDLSGLLEKEGYKAEVVHRDLGRE